MKKLEVQLFFIALLVGIVSLFSVSVAKADEKQEKQIEQIMKESQKEQKEEKKEVKESLARYLKEARNSTLPEKSLDGDFIDGEERYDLNMAYRVVLLSTFMLEDYNKEKGFGSVMTRTSQWKVPYSTEEGTEGIATLEEEDGQIEWLGESAADTMEKLPPSYDDVAKKVGEKFPAKETIKDIIYTYSPMYRMVLVYVTGKKQDYLIPYAECPDKMVSLDGKHKIKNGSVYEVDDFMDAMNYIFDENQGDGQENGGYPYRSAEQENQTLLLVVVAIVLLVCGAGAVVFVQHRRRNAKQSMC